MAGDDRRKAEALLGIEVPPEAEDVRIFVWRPSPDLGFFQAWVRMEAGDAAFHRLLAALGLEGDNARSSPHLPASWEGPRDRELPWWDASPETPADARGSDFGVNGRVVVRRERGTVYLIVTDTGNEGGTAGPW